MVKKFLSIFLAVIMVIGIIPFTVFAASNSESSSSGAVVADGTYTATSTSSYKKDSETYKATVNITVSNGKIASLTATGPTKSSDNESYFKKALTGISSKLIGQNATSNVGDTVDTVTGATNSSKLIKEAIGLALKSASSSETPSSGSESTQTGGSSSGTTDYVLVKTPQNGKKYIICEEDGKDDKDKDGYVLTGTGGTTELTVKSSKSKSYGATYITVSDENNVFTFTGSISSFTLKNNKGQFLSFNGNQKAPTTSSTGSNFQYVSNKYFKYGSYYLVEKDHVYTLRDDKDGKVYFFEQVETTPATYTVTWRNYDGSLLKTDSNVTSGTKPAYNGAVPSRSSTAQYEYTFNGWATSSNQSVGVAESNLPAVSGNVTYYAAFTQKTRSYPITWKNWDGTTLRTDTLDYGTVPDYGGTPTRPANGSTTYTFSGWSPTILPVTGSATYTATFSEDVPSIADGTYGDNSATVGRYVYKPIVAVIVENGIIKEIYADAETNDNNLEFLNDALEGLRDKLINKPVSEVDTVDAVSGATYASDALISDIKKGLSESPKGPYTVKWQDYDGTVLKTDTDVRYGSRTNSIKAPTRADDENYSYTFNGWNPDISIFVTDNAVYTAEYTAVKKAEDSYELTVSDITLDLATMTFTGVGSQWPSGYGDDWIWAYPDVTFKINGEISPAHISGSRELKFISADETIVKNQDDDLWFTLTGNAGETTVTAQVIETSTGKILAESLPFKVTVIDIQTPASDGIYIDGTQIIEDENGKFKYTPVVRLEIENEEFKSIDVTTVESIKGKNKSCLEIAIDLLKNNLIGKSATEVSIDEVDAISGATYSVTALKNSLKEALSADNTIVWKNDDNTVLDSANVTVNTLPLYFGATPTKTATAEHTYEFAGWSPELTAVTENAEYTATFNSTVNNYTVTWKNDDIINTTTVEYGTKVTKPENPIKEGYTFVGWYTDEDEEFDFDTPVNADLTLNAKWEKVFIEVKSMTVKFMESISPVIYVSIPNEYKSDDLKVVINCKGESVTGYIEKSFADLEQSEDKYTFSIDVPAKEIANTIEFWFENDSGILPLYHGTTEFENDICTTSVVSYCDTIQKTSSSDKMKNLAKALKNYGYYAYKYFVGNDPTLSDVVDEITLSNEEKLDIDSISLEELQNYSAKKSGEVTGLTPGTMSLVFKAESKLNVGFNLKSGYSFADYSFEVTDENGNNVDIFNVTYLNSSSVKVTVEGLTARKLNMNYNIKVTNKNDGTACTITVSGMSYAYTVLKQYSDSSDIDKQNLCNLVRAIYLYNQAAHDYFD